MEILIFFILSLIFKFIYPLNQRNAKILPGRAKKIMKKMKKASRSPQTSLFFGTKSVRNGSEVSLPAPFQCEINADGGEESRYCIDGIVGQEIDGSHAEEGIRDSP